MERRKEIELSENAEQILKARYLKKNSEGEVIETPEEMFYRVAQNIAGANQKYDEPVEPAAQEFYDVMTALEFLPNSPTLMNADNDLQQLSACFVLPVEDSMEDIFEAIKNAALIHKSGGGTGFSFSRLRPRDDRVRSTGGVASGPVSFMHVFDAATDTVKQGGKRRGANMGVLRVDHPDIREFISCKEDEDELNNFNISVALTEDFMKAVEAGGTYELINPRTEEAVASENAREIFEMVVEKAHGNGEPGIIFLDRINEDNPTPALGEIESTNPCGEQPLLPYEACNLGSINLSRMVKGEPGQAGIDYDKLEKTTRTAVRFLDNVIDMNEFPLAEIEEMVEGNRKIGLGVMGYSDMLLKLGLPYDSKPAVNTAREIMKFIRETARSESHRLAEKRGPFPNYQDSIYDKPYRNATTTTIAPTGSISILADTSSGIEPIFALCYERNVLDDTLIEVHPVFKEMAEKRGILSDELIDSLTGRNSIQDMEKIPRDIRDIFVTAHDISPEWHVRTQAAFQKNVDNAVSKTVNFRNDATIDDVREVYRLAYELGCKGVTIYRDGSRSEQVLTTDDSRQKPAKKSGLTKRERPQVTVGTTEKTEIGCGKLYITINSDDVGICEVFTTTGKGGGCHAQSEAISRLASLALRSGVALEEISRQLKGIRCEAAMIREEVHNLSCPDAIGRALEDFAEKTDGDEINLDDILHNSEIVKQKTARAAAGDEDDDRENSEPDFSGFQPARLSKERTCPDCDSQLESDGGCVVCRSCGWSRCS